MRDLDLLLGDLCREWGFCNHLTAKELLAAGKALTDTEFAHVADAEGSALFKGLLPVMSASDVAQIGYQGLKAGRGVVITGLVNKIMATSSRMSPTFVSMRIANWMMSTGK